MAVKAFPSAEGFGANSVGGRGGVVLFVTNLNDSGAGSLRAACQASGPRIVIFRVGGRIQLTSTLNITNPYLTLAGQTAPGGGIMITGASVYIRTHNVIGRFIRWKCGLANVPKTTGQDTNWVIYGDVAGTGDNIRHDNIFDHCEMMWSTDQCMDSYGNQTNTTYQHCIAAEGLRCGHSGNPAGQHSMGSLLATQPYYGNPIRISVHHCLYANCFTRMPLINSYQNPSLGLLVQQTELVNNVMYNWAADGGPSAATGAWHDLPEYNNYLSIYGWPSTSNANVAIQYNVIGCHMIDGPSSNPNSGAGWVGDLVRAYFGNNLYSPLGFSVIGPVDGPSLKVNRIEPPLENRSFGNLDNLNAKYPNYNFAYYPSGPFFRDTPWAFTGVPITTMAVGLVKASVLANAGCRKVVRNGVIVSIEDASITRIVNEVNTVTGQFGGPTPDYAAWQAGADVPYPTIASGTPYTDSNGDGIQDGWAGMPSGANANQTAPNGYTYIENFINEMAGDDIGGGGGPVPDTTPPSIPQNVRVS